MEETLWKEGIAGRIHKEGKQLAPNFRVDIWSQDSNPRNLTSESKLLVSLLYCKPERGKEKQNLDEKKYTREMIWGLVPSLVVILESTISQHAKQSLQDTGLTLRFSDIITNTVVDSSCLSLHRTHPSLFLSWHPGFTLMNHPSIICVMAKV